MVRCSICGGNTVETTDEYTNSRGVVVKNVPCYKCEKCGEIHYKFSVLKKAEKLSGTDYAA